MVYDKWNHGEVSDKTMTVLIKQDWCQMKRVLRKPGKNEIKMISIFNNKMEFDELDKTT